MKKQLLIILIAISLAGSLVLGSCTKSADSPQATGSDGSPPPKQPGPK